MSPRSAVPPLFHGGVLASLLLLAACGPDRQDTLSPADGPAIQAGVGAQATVSTFATGLNFPRGLRFGQDGYLYVGEAGTGGTGGSTIGRCDQVIPPVGPYNSGFTARIVKIDPQGVVTPVVTGLPSSTAAIGDVQGIGDVEWENHTLYALSNAGCSKGFKEDVAAVIKVGANGSWTRVANLSRFQKNNPVLNSEEEDFEPDGTWYSMIKYKGNLVAIEPNHGELDHINLKTGVVTRIADISASQGHIVPTAMIFDGQNFLVGNLNTFPIVPGSSKIMKITPGGQVSDYLTGFTTILGLAMDKKGRLYVLESSTAPGFPTPGTGDIVRVSPKGHREVIASGLFFPTGMTMGPDGNLYVSSNGYGPPGGDILKVTLP